MWAKYVNNIETICIHCYKYIYTHFCSISYRQKKYVDLYTNDQFEYHVVIKPVFQKARVSRLVANQLCRTSNTLWSVFFRMSLSFAVEIVL